MKKLKIALVYDAIYPFVKGGGEKRFYELGKRLAKMGYEVHWYGMKFWDGPSTYELDGIILHGICKARPLYTKSGRRSISQAIIFGISSFKLLGADYDVMDCCGFPYFSLFPAKLSTLIKRKPLYATWHEVWGKKYWGEYLGVAGVIGYWVERIVSMLPDTIIATSEHTANLLKNELNAKNVVVVTNGIDLELIARVTPSSQSSDVIYVGRIVDFKNIDLLIKALAELKKEDVLLSCTIIGDGPAKKDLQKLAEKVGVGRQMSWLPFLENSEDVYAHMKAASLFVLPSRREGFGIVAVEANACEIPVLTANFPANAAKNLITDGVNGQVFEPGAVGLASAIKDTLGSSEQLGNKSRVFARAFDWDALAAKQAEAYAL